MLANSVVGKLSTSPCRGFYCYHRYVVWILAILVDKMLQLAKAPFASPNITDLTLFLNKKNHLNTNCCVDDDQGWKIIHSDVFRFPSHKSLLCAVLGNGVQFLVITALLLVMATLGMFNVRRHHAMSSAGIALFVLTGAISGFISTRLFVQMEGQVMLDISILLLQYINACPFSL